MQKIIVSKKAHISYYVIFNKIYTLTVICIFQLNNCEIALEILSKTWTSLLTFHFKTE